MDNNIIRYAESDELRTGQGPGAPQEPRGAVALRPLAPGMRRLLFTASVLVLLAGIQLFVFTGHTGHFFAFTITNPLAAAFLGAGYWAAVAIEALAGRQALWANARIAVPTVLVFTVLTLAITLTHLGQLHLGARFATGTQIVTVAWIAIYLLVPALMLILLVVQARTPRAAPPRSAGLPAWLYAVLAVQGIVLLGLGIALFAAPGQAAPIWPWKLTPMMAQATGAWLISLGVAAVHALLERDARRLRPAAVGYIVLAVLLSIALARYPHQFEWRSASGIAYLIFLVTMLLTGVVGLARGLPCAGRPSPTGVVAAINFARRSGLRVAVQGTGHNAAPSGSLAGTVLIKTHHMRGVRVDPVARTVRVGAGALWRDVTAAAAQHGRAALAAPSPDAGVVGYTIGGGMSWLGRTHGLSANNVVAVELVTADGRFRRVDATSEPDLFWALRGGGGSFGVVTAIELRLFPVTEVYAGTLRWPIRDAPGVLPVWRELTHGGVPDEFTTSARLPRFHTLPGIPEPVRGRWFVVVDVVHSGSPAQAAQILRPLRALGPIRDTVGAMPARLSAGCARITSGRCPGWPMASCSRACRRKPSTGSCALPRQRQR